MEELDGGLARRELTRFTTASGYDKVQGTAPKLLSVELWRVRYPVSEIGSGNCVFDEYHGFIRLAYEPAVIPNTSPDGTIYSVTLVPKNGSLTQTFSFPGSALFTGQSPELDLHAFGPWRPELDPSREYCASISAFGDGDLARLPVRSERLCAPVKEVSSIGGQVPSADAGVPSAEAGVPATEAGIEAQIPSSGKVAEGCSCSLGRRSSAIRGWVIAATAALLMSRRTRRRKALNLRDEVRT
jgi:hypothetical protein